MACGEGTSTSAKSRGVAVPSSSSFSYNRRSPEEVELNSPYPHPVHQPTNRGRGGRDRRFHNGSRGNRRGGGFGGSSVDARLAERSQSSAASFGGFAQGFPGDPSRQEKDSTAVFAKHMEQKQDEVGYYTTDEDEKVEEELSMVKKATEKEDWNSGFGEEIHEEAKKYRGIGSDKKEEQKEEHKMKKTAEKEDWYSGFGKEGHQETQKYGGLDGDGKEEPKKV